MTDELNGKLPCECDNPDFFEGTHERQTCGSCGGLV